MATIFTRFLISFMLALAFLSRSVLSARIDLYALQKNALLKQPKEWVNTISVRPFCKDIHVALHVICRWSWSLNAYVCIVKWYFWSSLHIHFLVTNMHVHVLWYVLDVLAKVTSQSGYSSFRVHWTGEYILWKNLHTVITIHYPPHNFIKLHALRSRNLAQTLVC